MFFWTFNCCTFIRSPLNICIFEKLYEKTKNKKCGVSIIITDDNKIKTNRPTSVKIKLLTLLLQCLIVSVAFSQSLSLPYYTGFDSISEQAGWQEFRLGVLSLTKWSYSTNFCSAPNSLFHGYNVSGSATDTVEDWFVRPPLKISTPAKLTLNIFPNPFKTTTTIFIDIDDNVLLTSPLEIRMYDIFGREIKRIKKIRNKEIQITRDNLSGGLYFIKLIKDDKIIDNRKIIIE